MASARELKLLDAIAAPELPKTLFNIEVIGKDQLIVAGEFTASLAIPVSADGAKVSGRLLGIHLMSLTEGTGLVNVPVGEITFFRADPTVVAGATALAANGADHRVSIGSIVVKSSDWVRDASGATATILMDLPFTDLENVFMAFFFDLASGDFNTVAAEDEVLEMNVTYSSQRN